MESAKPMSPLEQIKSVYESLPTLNCKGWCWHSCGPIDMSDAEHDRITALGVDIPVFDQDAAQRWAENEKLYCPALEFGVDVAGGIGCSVYQDRPLICRLWGVTESMRCEFGCEPSETLSDKESFALLFKAMKLGGHRLMEDFDEERFMATFDDPEFVAEMQAFLQGDTTIRDQVTDSLTRRMQT